MFCPLYNVDVDPPRVDYFYPDGVIKKTRGENIEIIAITVGRLPLNINWTHNGSIIVNLTTLNNTSFMLTDVPYSDNMHFSKLTISSVGEVAQGVYKIVANNTGGRVESEEEVQLMLGELHKACPYIGP